MAVSEVPLSFTCYVRDLLKTMISEAVSSHGQCGGRSVPSKKMMMIPVLRVCIS